MSEQKREELTTFYQEVCRVHDGIADFRAKLLALLPIASGAGIFLLVGNQPGDAELPHLLPIGVFGVLITLGLFFYELRGIQKCNGLIKIAKRIENRLTPAFKCLGAFNFRLNAVFGGLVGATGAALVIYPTVIGAWVYVAGVEWYESLDRNGWTMVVAAAAVIGFALLGKLIDILQGKQLDHELKKLDAKLNSRGAEFSSE